MKWFSRVFRQYINVKGFIQRTHVYFSLQTSLPLLFYCLSYYISYDYFTFIQESLKTYCNKLRSHKLDLRVVHFCKAQSFYTTKEKRTTEYKNSKLSLFPDEFNQCDFI